MNAISRWVCFLCHLSWVTGLLCTLKSYRSQVGIRIVLLYEFRSARSPQGIYFLHSPLFPLHSLFFLILFLSFFLSFFSLFLSRHPCLLWPLHQSKLKVGGGIQGRKCVGGENGNAVGPAATQFCFAGRPESNECFGRGSSVGISLSLSC